MSRQTVYVVCAKGEEAIAEQLAQPLREAGYQVTHDGTVAVGESLVGEAAKALSSGSPIILCATTKAAGSAWSHQIVNAGHSEGRTRVFVVQMEKQAYVEQLALKAKVARFCDDPAAGLRDLIDALAKHFPPVRADATTAPSAAQPDQGRQYLDQSINLVTFDVEALQRFRGELREEIAARHPAMLSPWEFLERAGLWAQGSLTRTGALLFGKSPTSACVAAIVKCVRYYGLDRAERRDIETFDGTVPDQIVAAREFVARHVRRGEQPSGEQAQSVAVYDYPMIAVREIVANALVHRDYSMTDACVHVRIFQDRLEISSPGTWLGHDLPDGFHRDLAELDGQSIKRNFRLAHVLSWVRLVEGEGSGIPSALRDCQRAETPTPTVVQEQDFVTVTIRPRRSGEQQSVILTESAQRRVIPATLPSSVAGFVGRNPELATLSGLLRDRADTGGTVVISAIGGTAGVGKTALAVYWAHQVADRFPDGQLYVNLRGFDPIGSVMDPAEAVRRFLHALQVPPERIPVDLDGQVALYRSQLAGKRMLVMLDNARDTAQVRPLLPGAPTCLVVVTSRNQLTSLIATDGAHPITLDLLTTDEAHQLLTRRLGTDRVAAEPAAVAEIITRCAHLPLALALVAARAAIQPQLGLHLLAEQLRDTQHPWQALTGDDPTTDVWAVFSWSYQALTQDAARLFRLLGLHPGPDLSAPAAASLAGVAVGTVTPLLGQLSRASLLVEHTPGRYSFHDLLRAYATDLTHTTDITKQRHSATHRILDHYLHTAYTAARLLDPARDPITLTPPQPGVTPEPLTDYQQALDWFTAEHSVLLAAVDLAATTGFDSHTWQLTRTLDTFLDRRGHWHDLVAAGHAAVAAAHRLADPSAQARAHRNLAHAYIRLGRFDDAHIHLGHALDLATETSDQTGQAHTHHILSSLWEQRGSYPQALDHARQALDLYRNTGDPIGQANALNTVGWYQALLGEYQQALTACQQALTLLQDLTDRAGQAATLDSLGYVHHHLGNHTHAITCYQHALTLCRDLGDRYDEATALTHLGATHHAIGNLQAAHDAWQQALTILDDLQHPNADQIRTKLTALD